MTYSTLEKSAQDGEPIEFYEFTRGTARFRYTSAQEDVIVNSATYLSIPIQRSTLEDSGELGRAPITVSMPRDVEFMQQYISSPPSEVTTLTVSRTHNSLPDGSAVVVWVGRLLNTNWKGSVVELSCEPVFTSIKRLGLRKKYSRLCTHVLYGKKCGVNNTAWKATGPVIGIDGHKVSVAIADTNGDNYYSGGYAEWDYDGRKEKRMIMRQIGSQITLSGVPTGLQGGDTIAIYPGCDHTLATCNGKFNNKLNYGGFAWIPVKNPFSFISLW